jgi:hypothetical protein
MRAGRQVARTAAFAVRVSSPEGEGVVGVATASAVLTVGSSSNATIRANSHVGWRRDAFHSLRLTLEDRSPFGIADSLPQESAPACGGARYQLNRPSRATLPSIW